MSNVTNPQERTSSARILPDSFYRPELDALRFFAFLCVLIHHGPEPAGVAQTIRDAGGFGLSIFFLLSAYLITELLLRERESSGSVAWGRFFLRRSLRIWPLYYAALAGSFAIAKFFPHQSVSTPGLLAMSLFIANWTSVASQLGVLIGPLWSISVEEQFYLVWAPVLKFGGARLAFAVSLLFILGAAFWLNVFTAKGWKLWYDTPVELLFFAAGSLIALATHRRTISKPAPALRCLLAAAALALLVFASRFGGIGTDWKPNLTFTRLSLGYGAAALACAMLFLAVLGITAVPRSLTYLGKISYGLYVFHPAILGITEKLVKQLPWAAPPTPNMLVVDSISLLLCITVAHFSYQYFEMPFLRLKERFAVIKSRPA